MDARVLAWLLTLTALIALPTVYMLTIVAARLPH